MSQFFVFCCITIFLFRFFSLFLFCLCVVFFQCSCKLRLSSIQHIHIYVIYINMHVLCFLSLARLTLVLSWMCNFHSIALHRRVPINHTWIHFFFLPHLFFDIYFYRMHLTQRVAFCLFVCFHLQYTNVFTPILAGSRFLITNSISASSTPSLLRFKYFILNKLENMFHDTAKFQEELDAWCQQVCIRSIFYDLI